MNDTRDRFGRAFLQFAVAWTLPVIAMAADRPLGGHIDRGGSLLKLFTEPEDHQDDGALTDPTVVRSRPVVVDLGALSSLRLQVGDVMALELFDDVEVSLVIERIEGHPEGRFVATGRLADQDGGSFVIVAEQGVLVANIRAPDVGHFQIRYSGDDVHIIREIDDSQFHECGGAIEPIPPGPDEQESRRETRSTDNGDEIDVIVLYTDDARLAAGGTNAIRTIILMAIAESNMAYENSQIIPRLRLLHMDEVAYNEPSSFSTILNDLQTGTNGLSVAHALRTAHCADIVSLLVANSQFGGLGYSLNADYMPPSTWSFEDWAFNVVNWNAAATNLTLPHEIGHNMGCHHDRENACCSSGGTTSCLSMACAGTSASFQSQAAYVFSYGSRNPVAWRTIMAYSNGCTSCPRIPHFSNPQVNYQGQPTGVPGGHPFGSDNAVTIDNTRTTVAQWRKSCEVTGACCDPVGGCLQATSSVCQTGGGTYLGDNTVCLGDANGDGIDDACASAPTTGACCGSSGSGGCIIVAQLVCTAGSGTYMGDGTSCTPSPCGAVSTGACCEPCGCSDTDAATCSASGGFFHGPGTDCASVLCLSGAPSACCLPTGSCTFVDAACCAAQGGTHLPGTNCSSSLCFGACCDPSGGCTGFTTELGCQAGGGTFQGPNTTCAPGMCSAPGAPIDFITPPATYATDVFPVAVAAGDLDADGDEDLLVANVNNGTNGTVTILTNDGTGVFVVNNVPIVGGPLEDVIVADFDADGDLDLASASGAAVINWNNNGSFAVWRMLGVGAIPSAIVADDFDGDCTIDLATANSNPPGNNVAVLLNVDGVFFSPLTTLYSAGTNPLDLASGDMDGDGDPDLVVANASSGDVSVLFNDGLGNFSAPVNFASGMPTCCLYAIALGDLDGDVDLDVVVTNANEDEMAILLNDGLGNLGPPYVISVGNFPADVSAVDLDGDGDLDLAVSNSNFPYQLQVLANDGNGNFDPPLNFTLEPGPKRLVVANLDSSDGALDVAVAMSGSDKVAILLNVTDQDCNGNGIADQTEPTSSMSFIVGGVSSATPCTWRIHGNGFDIEGEFCVTAGGGGGAIATEIIERVNATGCPGIRAEHINGLPNGFTIMAPGNSLNLCIGTAPGAPGCCFPGASVCTCNPDIEELVLNGDDCNGNGVDDVIDIANGTSQDQDGNGIPDECFPSLPGDMDGDDDVDAADLAILLGSWGPYSPCPPYVPADINQDCSVDAADLAQLLGSWGP